MKIPSMIMAELRRLTSSPMSIVALIALTLVPILYGGLYLWANQDPYARLDQVPAAIVVLDQGADSAGEQVNHGNDVAAELLEDDTFDWHLVSASDAAAGVADQEYDFSITFPADFSADLVSTGGNDPRQASVVLTTNDANSYLATTIGTQATERIRAMIARQVGQEAAARLLVALGDVRAGLVDAADGATRLYDGATTAAAGSERLSSGTQQVSDGAADLASGLDALSTGAASLPSSTARLADGAAQVAAGNAQLAGIGEQVSDASAALVADLPAVRTRIETQLRAQGLTDSQVLTILATLDDYTGTATEADSTVQSAADRLGALADGSAQVAAGAAALAEAAPRLTAGIDRASSGADDLAEGSAFVADGAADLSDGLADLQSGLGALQDGLDDAAGQLPDSSADLRAQQAATIADPVDVDTDAITAAENYGAGLAPFFVSLAAWIGIYALFLIIKPVSRRAITALHSPVKVTLAGWLTPGLLGLIQVTGLFLIVTLALGFTISNPVGTLAMMMLASLTFAAIILALNVWLGSVGQFIGLVLMVLQLVTAGGTFPWQTLPAPLAWLHHVLPMSYAVDGMRQVMYGGATGAALADATALGIFLVVALGIASVGVTRMTHFRTLRDLRPSLIG